MQEEKNIFTNKIFAEIFDTFIDRNVGIFENSYLAFTAVEVCNVIASALVILQDGDIKLNEVIKYDLPGKLLALKLRLAKSGHKDKDSVIFLLDIIRSAPAPYFYDVFEFIESKVKNKISR